MYGCITSPITHLMSSIWYIDALVVAETAAAHIADDIDRAAKLVVIDEYGPTIVF